MPRRKEWKYTSVNFQKEHRVKLSADGKSLEVTTLIPIEEVDIPSIEHKLYQLDCGCEDGVHSKCDWTCRCDKCHDGGVQMVHTAGCIHDATDEKALSVEICICPCHEKNRPHKNI